MIVESSNGLFCERGGFYVDPWQPVERAIITHAHGDHARSGSAAYLCAAPCEPLLRYRLPEARIEALPYGQPVTIGDVRVSLHPAGHILGSAQVRLEVDGEVWVISGDYKRAPDPTCRPFEPLRCHTFVTEATFGLPIYTWDAAGQVIDEIVEWWQTNRSANRPSVLFCYALGKAQRLLASLGDALDEPVRLHGAIVGFSDIYRQAGISLAAVERITESMRGRALSRSLVLAPLSARGTPWMRRMPDASSAFASGLMRIRGIRRQRAFERGFVLSDHADWPSLLETIQETGASRVLVTHGWSEALARFLAEKGLETGALHTAYEGELVAESEAAV